MSEESRAERRKKTKSRIHRLQGQLSALERILDEDRHCEEITIQVRAIQKAVDSLAVHVAGGLLRHQIRETLHSDPDRALADMERIFDLLNR